MQKFTIRKDNYQKIQYDIFNKLIHKSYIPHENHEYKVTWQNDKSKAWNEGAVNFKAFLPEFHLADFIDRKSLK
jgi:hypothetical protein